MVFPVISLTNVKKLLFIQHRQWKLKCCLTSAVVKHLSTGTLCYVNWHDWWTHLHFAKVTHVSSYVIEVTAPLSVSVGHIMWWSPCHIGIWTAIHAPQHVLLWTAIGIDRCWWPRRALNELLLPRLSWRKDYSGWWIARCSQHVVCWNNIGEQSTVQLTVVN